MMFFVRRLSRGLGRIERYLVTGFLLLMLGLTVIQLLLRNLVNTSLGRWLEPVGHFILNIPFVGDVSKHLLSGEMDPVVRHLVLWVGFIGAAIAAREDGHLAMDLATRFLPKKLKRVTSSLVHAVSAFVCACLAHASYKFVLAEKTAQDWLLPDLLPTYVAIAVIPFGFAVIALRFALKMFGPGIEAEAVSAIRETFSWRARLFSVASGVLALGFLLFVFKPELFVDSPPQNLGLWIKWAIFLGIPLVTVLGAPLFVIFGAISLYAFYRSGVDTSAIIIEMYRLASAPTLIAIPLFTFAGYLMAESKTPERLVALAKPLFGWMPGGLAMAAIVACAFFTAFTGASGVTIIALGGLLHPILVKEGYKDRFSMGLVTTCGSVGLMFPPSLPLILFALFSQANTDQLFIAGLMPGFFIVALLSGYSVLKNLHIAQIRHPFSWRELGRGLRGAAWELPLPFIILIGIYGGFVTASEAAAIAACYVLVVQVFIYRDLSLTRDVPRIAAHSMVVVGSIVVIFAVAMGFTSYLIDERVPMELLEWIRTFITSRWAFLLALNIFLLIVGSLMDIFSAIIVVVPLIMPIARQFGVDPLHLGIIFLTNLEIGYLHPPVGLNLFLSSLRFKRSILSLYRDTFPFLVLLVIALAVVTYWPDLSLFLVRLVRPVSP